MTDREAIITKIESLLDDAPVTDWVGGGVLADTRGLARNIVAVFEKALGEATVTPTDDEREALAALIDPDGARAGWSAQAHDVRDQLNGLHIKRGVYRTVDRILAAGFRRSEPEPSAEPSDAVVEAFMRSFWSYAPPPGGESRVRAALRAASEAGREGR